MRDRLRAVECPAEIIDQIGGWYNSSVGRRYGSGFKENVTVIWIRKALEFMG